MTGYRILNCHHSVYLFQILAWIQQWWREKSGVRPCSLLVSTTPKVLSLDRFNLEALFHEWKESRGTISEHSLLERGVLNDQREQQHMITLNNLKQISEILEEIALLWMTYVGCHITKLPINKVNKPLQMWVCVCVWPENFYLWNTTCAQWLSYY